MKPMRTKTYWPPMRQRGEFHHARVKRYVIDIKDGCIGLHNEKPLLESIQYEVKLSDSETEVLTSNFIEEKLLAQVDNNITDK